MAWLRSVGLTHPGRVRQHNEDAIALGGRLMVASTDQPMCVESTVFPRVLCLVADGMGGHAAGEIASRLAAESLVRQARVMTNEVEIAKAIESANAAVHESMAEDPARIGMGTTIAGLVVSEDAIFAFNVGDSRVYQIVGGHLRLLTLDDTPSFALDGPEVRTGQSSHALTRCLGGMPCPMAIAPHIQRLPPIGRQRFLLCSDGLTDMLDQRAIEACVRDDAELVVVRLFAAAMDAGGTDNISVVIIDYLPDGPLFED